MGMGFALPEQVSGREISDYGGGVTYELAAGADQKEEVYRLRYGAYRRENVILPNPAELFSDHYDTLANCWAFSIRADAQLIASIRVHVISKQFRMGPALDVFPDIVSPLVEQGMVIVDPTRFVIADKAIFRYPELPFITMRVPCMACEVFDADYCLATVREEHVRFYKRVFDAEQLCESRPYPELMYRICAMSIDVRKMRKLLRERHQVFNTTIDQWRELFSRGMQPADLTTDLVDVDSVLLLK